MIVDYQHLLEEALNTGAASGVVGLLVTSGQRVLLLKRRSDDFMPNLWEIPGGHVDGGESIPEALARELKEETGLNLIAIVGYCGSYDYDGEFGLTRQWNFEVHVERAAISHPEHAAAAWCTPKDWAALDMSSEMRKTLQTFQETAGWTPTPQENGGNR